MVDVLEVSNTEQQAARMQLAAAIQAMEYIAEVVYHHYVAGREGSGKEWEGTVVQERRETREAGIGTSEVPGKNSKD